MVPQSIRYGDERIDFSVRFNRYLKRKITVSIDENGNVRIAAPEGTDLEDIRKAVRKRARWISTQVRGYKAQIDQLLPRAYVSGETHLYLGKQYLLKVQHDSKAKPGVKLIRGRLIAAAKTREKGEVQNLLDRWYRNRAEEIYARRLTAIAKDVAWLDLDRLPEIRLLAMRKQWGSCSPKGRILLNPALVKAPRECVDYVITHELCHLREHNHSSKFYRLLVGLMPDWEARKARLDNLAAQLLSK